MSLSQIMARPQQNTYQRLNMSNILRNGDTFRFDPLKLRVQPQLSGN